MQNPVGEGQEPQDIGALKAEIDSLKTEVAAWRKHCQEKGQVLISEIAARRRAEARVRVLRAMLKEMGVDVS